MRRREDWAERLHDYLDARRDVPFSWSGNDCTTFAAGAIEAMTEEKPPLPAYAGLHDAARLLDERALRERVGDVYGPEIVPAFAQRGDVVLVEIGGRESLAVCIGAEAAGPGPDGMLTVPMSTATAAWRV
jgi:hypothetical protein